MTAAPMSNTGGTNRHRLLGSRPSGKYSSSSPTAANSHDALSFSPATSQSSWTSVSVRPARTCHAMSLATVNDAASPTKVSNRPTTLLGCRRAITTPSTAEVGATATPTARVISAIAVGACTANPVETTSSAPVTRDAAIAIGRDQTMTELYGR
jgi:hypothetical protein